MNSEPPDSSGLDWRARRAGSLRSLNQIGTGFALRMLEDFTAERLQSHAWSQLDFGPAGTARLDQVLVPPPGRCLLCSIDAIGDAGLSRYRDTLRNTVSEGANVKF